MSNNFSPSSVSKYSTAIQYRNLAVHIIQNYCENKSALFYDKNYIKYRIKINCHANEDKLISLNDFITFIGSCKFAEKKIILEKLLQIKEEISLLEREENISLIDKLHGAKLEIISLKQTIIELRTYRDELLNENEILRRANKENVERLSSQVASKPSSPDSFEIERKTYSLRYFEVALSCSEDQLRAKMIRKDAFKVVDGYKLIVNKEIFEENVDFCFRESRGVKQPVFYECGKSKLFSLLRNS